MPVGPEDLAYVIYTSGSTGRPKGVAVHHRALMNLVSWHQRTYALTPKDSTALTAGVAFDASTWEVWPSLASGASLVVPPDAVRAEPSQLLQWLAREAITTCFMPTPLAEAVLREEWPRPIALRALLTGGDALHHGPPPSVPAALFNHYGPTESTVVATFTPVMRDDGTRPPIGRPIANTRTYVLDANLQPVPVGVPGELFLASEGLAWGYLGQPALSAERFIPHPFSSTPGARLYRTGDVVRWRADGQLDYLQRLDFQVKVRGFRIELGEIEASLLAHASVREAVVLAREDVPGDKRLVAYVVGEALDVSVLRAHLKQHLPEYMVPAAFVPLDALPLNANGKVDRKALPVPDASPLADFVAPRDATEEKLAGVFAQVLRVERVGIHDDFFALGGHSLLATQLVSRIRATFDAELPLRSLFEAPTVAALAERLRTATSGSRLPPLTRATHDGPPPLSFAQQRLWLLDQLQPGSAAYNIPAALRLKGQVDIESLRRAFEALVARHETLRTTLVQHQGQPAQHIHAPTAWTMPLLDVSSLPEPQREEEARRLANVEALRPFDLEAGPLLRTSLVHLGDAEHLLLVTMHHIVSDGWSMGVLVRELTALYAAFDADQVPALAPLPVQYADFAVWQQAWLQGETLEAQLAYWKEKLAGAPAALELPTDRPRPPVQSHRGSTVPLRLARPVSDALKVLAQREGATPFMLLLAAFQVLLSRYSGQDDISVGTPIAGRTQAETEGLIGFFINTLVLRARVQPESTFRELLAQVRGTTLAAYEHQHLPFEKLVEAVQPVRDLSRSALFQAMFVLQNAPTEALSVPGLSFEQLPLESASAKFDLTLTLQESPQGFMGVLEYSSDLFDASTAQRMVGHFGVLLEAIAAQPGSTLSRLPLLTAPERQQLLVDWNRTDAEFPRDTCFHEAFTAQALRTPAALAVVCLDQQLTFQELDARSNQLAHRLVKLGVGPDVRVVLCVERSVEALIGILGILKAGGAYVPLDSRYPREWLAHVLTDTGAPVVLTQQRLRDALPPHTAHVVCLDLDVADFDGESREAPGVAVSSEQLAYVIYTSGSTGRPKGVMIQHRSVMNLRQGLATTVHQGRSTAERVSVNAPLSFDASVQQLVQVLDGHTLCIVPDEARADASELVKRIGHDALDVLDCSPAHLRLLVDEGLLEKDTLPRRALVGGEAVDPGTWSRLAQHPRLRAFNVYGPTECTVDATACAFDASPIPTIGRPLPNVRAYVLDKSLRPVPVGVAGELFLGGEGVARGYLNRPDLTADRFIPDAFTSTPGARLYRTGDVVRWRVDGMLDYLGRADFQVKVRGFRIELGEIESTLLKHPQVHAAVVLAREDIPGDKRLVAYVVPAEGTDSALTADVLKDWLKQFLPEHMRPSTFLVLEALPLNPNGKVDRKALPAPQGTALASTYVAPRTAAEEQLAALFTQVLRVERVGIHDDFFALGGHSLLATQLVSRIRAAFRTELPLRALFEAPTVAALAQRLQVQTPSLRLPPLTRTAEEGPRPLSFAQQRLWFLDQLTPGDASYNLPTALRLTGQVDVESLRRAFEALVTRHDSLRTTFREHQGQTVQHVHAPATWGLPLVDLSALPEAQREAEARRKVEEDAHQPFHLEAGPLLRTALVRLAAEEHLLLVTMHHIVSDGWSMGVLVRELVTFYEAFTQGIAPDLSPLPVQYADFAAWQRQWLQGETLGTQLAYWKQQLAGAPSALELLTDHPRPSIQSHEGAALSIQIPRETSEALKALAGREGATPFMVLLAAYQVFLSRYAGQDDISVGSPIAGRTQAETEGLIGFFVNTLVLRARVEPMATFRELLAQVRGTTLAAYEHQHLPFEKLVEAVQPARDASRSPLFQVMFALQNAPTEELRVPGLAFRQVAAEARSAKFDLTLTLQDSAQGFVGWLEYSTALFKQGTVERMARHLRTLLEAVASRPEQSVAELTLLSREERQRILVDWNDTTAASPTDVPVHVHFARQVQRTPDAVALEQGDATLTYAQLEARANQLAHHLRALGIVPGARVGVAIERSFELVTALLAILKAGAAFVPVDRNAPVERIATLLEDADVGVVLTHQPFASKLPASGTRVWLDAQQDVIAARPTHALDVSVEGESLAYVMFTSGSTGRPKGVCVPHRGITRLVLGSTFMRFGPDEVWLQFAPVAFDASTLEMWGALLHGAKLVLAPPHALSLEELATQLRRHRVSALFLTTALFEQMALHQGEVLAGVSQLLTGGELMPWARLRDHLARLPDDATLMHAYGPTENTTFSTTLPLHRGAVVEGPVSIGRPIPNSTAYVLDAHLHPVPVGVAGEVYVGGPGLAWGYLHRPDLTAERFVPHPFTSIPGERLYRTGDKARWLEDGTLDFLGRVDFQVKVRGFRIEPGEIETALHAAPGVNEAVVVVRGVDTDKRLVGYVTAHDGHALEADDLKAHLRRHLPEYMVPSALVVLEALPLNVNGKVDRKALPEPEDTSRSVGFVAPRTATEEQLAALFAEVLRVERVGIQDDFFALGGHSLLATQLVSRVRATFAVELPLRALFEAPTVEGLAPKLDGDGAATLRAPPLRPVAREGAIPLSFAQQRLWLLDQLQPGDASYNIPTALRLTGQVDVESLRRAFEALVARHESLRTTLSAAHEEPSQCIQPPSGWELPVIDLTSLPESQREEEARRAAATEAHRSFRLATGPLLRSTLVRLNEAEHLLLVTMHHIVSDGWSMGVLVRELAAFYEAFSEGKAPSLAPLPVQYADFAMWQRQWLQGEALDAQLGYWKQQLSGAPAALDLPTDRSRPPVQSHRGATLDVRIPTQLSESLKALAQREGATPFMLLLAAFQVLLSRYSAQDDISVGSPIAGRTQAETEGLIGFFVNTLVLRAQMDPRATFRELLAQVRGTTLAAYDHQHLPFEKLVEAVQPTRDLSRSPLFQAMFVLQNTPTETLRLPGLSFQTLPLESHFAKFDLSLGLRENRNGFAGTLDYATDLFDAATVQRMAGHFGVLLETIAKQPDTRLGDLPLLTDAERQQLLIEWNPPASQVPRESSIPAMVEAQVHRSPDGLAVITPERQLTYRELDAKANQLAHRLRGLGVGPEVRVGLCVDRTEDLVIGALGILKAGGAYVPLDPSYPRERLGWLLEDAQGPALVAHSHLLSALPETTATPVCLDSDAELPTQPTTSPLVDIHAGHLAYLIYTSGSTGRPKGVAISHGNAVSFLHWALETFSPEELKGTLAATSLNFDLSVFELFAPLSSGGAVVVARNALHLAELPTASHVTLVNTVPSAMAQLLRLGAVPPSVRVINLAGEALPETLAKQVYAVPTVEKLFNLYGPSEDTTYSTASLVGRDEVPLIGRPLPATRAYVLDASLQPVPVGVAGELYLAGEGQARGYLLRPELTAERFVPELFGPPGGRMYRTGDRVRYRLDGRLEYLGRIDFQVKVRGFRIELGEIEAALRRAPGLKDVVVVAKGEAADKRLVAYVTPKAEASLEVESLRAHLRQCLPEYMVPAAFVVLLSLPLNSNGKVDRKALPEPEAQQAGSTYEAPRTLTEEQLANLFAEVLRMERVGVRDDFFAMGGHSLLATQLVSRVRATFEVELPLRALFEAPTVEALAPKLAGARSAALRAPPLQPSPREGVIPLSFAQQRLWLLDQLQPGDISYNIPTALRLTGQVDLESLRRAFEALVDRHESLRTTLSAAHEEPSQCIQPPSGWELPVIDLTSLPESQREEEAQRAAATEALRAFDLSTGPLLRSTLVRLGQDSHLLLVTMHHIVSDGWSLGVLVREVAACYEAFSTGRAPVLPPLPVQYADFAMWQRGWLQGESLDAQLGYWKQQLAEAPSALDLPTDHPRPPVQSRRGATVDVRIPLEVSQALKALARDEGATPFMLLLAAWQLLLSRYSTQDDISVGTPIAGRTQAETEGLIGFFVNTLVLRAHVQPQDSFRQLLSQVRGTTLAAYEHQHLPFEKLVEVLQPARDLSRSALFQAMFSLQNTPMETLRLPGLSFQTVPVDTRSSKFDLTLTLQESPQGFGGTLTYATDLFDASTIQRMAGHLGVLLEAIAAQPDATLASLPLLTAPERQRLLVDWNGPSAEFPRDLCLHDAFSAQALRTPDALAVICREEQLTFRELDTRANQLAHRLVKLGVGPDVRVVLCVERSVEALVGILGTLKAGGAYVPIDPSYPRDWLAHVLQDTGAPVVLTQQRLRDSLPPHSAHTLCLDSDSADLSREPAHAPVTHVTPEHLAYIIYTSGSTGRPKGVMIQHRSVLNLRVALAATVHADARPGERVSVNAPLSFDASVKQLIQVLDGHTLCIVPDEARADVGELVKRIGHDALDVLDCSPAHLRLLVDEGLLERKAIPHRVLVGGEAVDPATWRHLAQAPRPRVFNVYGPTECTVDATACAFDASPTPTIGRPLPNVRVYVLDRTLRPVPAGVAGELFIGGEGVARGYLNRPELTADRFIPDAFSSTPGARLYRTGDVVRWRADGMLDYLGRADFQVKVRGFRIELGEVEAALLKHPQVHAAVVLAREDVPGDKRLVAYVVPPEGTESAPTPESLKDWLKQLLPEHMRPSALLVLEALPLNTNGKVDRKALPAPQSGALASSYVAPRTPTEEKLASIWAGVLRLPQVGVTDSFFELGGHSLLATQVVSRVRAGFNVELPLRALFESPTVEALAVRLSGLTRTSTSPLTRVSHDGPLPLSFAQQRMWLIDQLEPGSPLYNMPVAVRLEGHLRADMLDRALQEVVRRHDALRTTFTQVAGEPVQRIHSDSPVPLGLVDLSDLPEAQREPETRDRVDAEMRRPFDLRTGPLIRTLLFKLSEREHILVVTMHHIVSDGWSLGVLVREVTALYAAFSAGLPSPLPALSVQYADYADWQRRTLSGETLRQEMAYWEGKLSGAPAVLELPTDFPRPAVRSTAGATLGFTLSRELTEALRSLGHREGGSLFMVLLAAWQGLMSRYTGQQDLSVGSPIAGRTRAETEGLIGFFVNTLVLRAKVDEGQSFQALLQQVRATVLEAYEHQEVPFEKLVEVLQPTRSLSHTPLFQTLLALQNVPTEHVHLPDLRLRRLEATHSTSKFDVSVFFTETSEGLLGTLEYSTALFKQSTVERMARHLRTLLEAVAAKPEQPMAHLPLLSNDERQRLLVEWNDTGVTSPTEVPVHVHFARHAQRTPDAVALVLGDVTLTYGQLDARANQLAWHLRALGIAPGARVGLAVERSFDLVTALLAILKVGAAFVPVDRNAPVERIAMLLEDADVGVVVTHQPFASLLPATGTRVWMDSQSEEIAARPTHAPDVGVDGEALAYVMFTSGSTGRPKGVCVPHRGITRLVLGNTFMRFAPDEVWLQFAPVAFDASTLEIWGALLHGAKLVLAPPHSLSLEELAAQLRHHRVTSLWLTAALFEQMALHQGEALAGVRQVLAGGDVLPAARVREHLARLSDGATFINGYGPTENTTFSTTFSMQHGTRVEGAIPIGRPLSNSTVYVLDAHLHPVPVGVAGEVYVGGHGLAWGYLNRPELTAERFFPHPFASTPGERLYRTGDQARWREDGTIDFLGRVDFQVKVRGFRIELGEVEAALRSAAGVNEAIVVARGADADKRLVAYVTASEGHSLEADTLKVSLKQRLPEYMVPSAVVVLDALPLNANGKVDRKALPEPDAHAVEARDFVAPRDALEMQLARIWEDVLGVRSVGVRSSFFELGGHSLLAVRMLASIRERLGLSLPLSVLFQQPTIEQLAQVLRDDSQDWTPLVPLERGEPGHRPLFLVHPGGGNVLAYSELARRLGPSLPVYGLQSRGLDGRPVAESIEEMATLYIDAIRTVQPHGPYQLGGWSLGGVIAYEMARRLREAGEAVDLLALIDAHVHGLTKPTQEATHLDSEARARLAFAHATATAFGQMLSVPDEALAQGDDVMLDHLLQEGLRARILDAQSGPAQLRALFNVFRANLFAHEKYVPQPYDGTALLLSASEAAADVPRHRGWEPLVRGGLEVHDVAGGHHELMQDPHLGSVVERLREALARVSGTAPRQSTGS
ncbi:non-ribosomal peptide synthetase, partial [Corallococcus sp. CA041A]|uniref:non-ribosomal peptide synthase/polyketide synthase n=1 Tax=Corallococcus sp. CA041A TaxID=2316727 RepID=UPI000ED061C4